MVDLVSCCFQVQSMPFRCTLLKRMNNKQKLNDFFFAFKRCLVINVSATESTGDSEIATFYCYGLTCLPCRYHLLTLSQGRFPSKLAVDW